MGGGTENKENNTKQHKWGQRVWHYKTQCIETWHWHPFNTKRWKTGNTEEQGTCWDSALHTAKSAESVENLTTSRQFVGQHIGSSQTSRTKYQSTVRQEYMPQLTKQDWQDRCFDAVRVKYINLNSVKSVKFTKLELASVKKEHKYKIDSGADV